MENNKEVGLGQIEKREVFLEEAFSQIFERYKGGEADLF